MTFLPVVERELRVAARRRAAFWTRLVAAGVGIFVGGGGLWFGGEWTSSAGLGASIFGTLAFLAMGFCVFAGPLFTADVLSEERREGTLGFLFLTDLRDYDVVLGKLAASSVTGIFSLLAVVPVLALSLMLGGVSLGEFGRMVLALGNTLFLSLALGMLVSAGSWHARSAMAMTGLLLFLLLVLAPWVEHGFQASGGSVPVALGLRLLSPVTAFWTSRTGLYDKAPAEFWASLAVIQVLAWGALAAASWVVSRVWRETFATALASRWRERWQRWNYGQGPARQALRRELLERSPVLWLGARNRLKPALLRSALGLALAGWVAACLLASRNTWDLTLTLLVAMFLQTPLKWLMASEATHRWVEDRQSGALELLLTTPVTVADLLRGHLAALRRLFLGPALALVGIEIVSLSLSADSRPDQQEAGWLAVAGMGIFLFDLHTLGWQGLWLGLTKRKTNLAFQAALTRVLLLPWLVFLPVMFLVGYLLEGSFALTWFLVCASINTLLYFNARWNLQTRFRAVLTERYQTPGAV